MSIDVGSFFLRKNRIEAQRVQKEPNLVENNLSVEDPNQTREIRLKIAQINSRRALLK